LTETIEFEGDTEEQAVERAAEALGIDRDSVTYTVVDEGSGGVLGLGARPVKIRADAAEGDRDSGSESAEVAAPPPRRGPAPEKAAKAGEVVGRILNGLEVEATVEVRDEDENIVVVIEGPEGSTRVAEVLGGRRPPVIPALQFLVNKIVNRFPEDRKHINIEVPSVPKRERRKDRPAQTGAAADVREDAPMPSLDELREAVDEELDRTLVEVGLELAERAQKLGKTLTIHPMLAGDRRAVHQTIMKIPGVRTVSEGEGLYRRLHVVPAALGGGSGARNKRRRRRRRGPGKGGAEVSG